MQRRLYFVLPDRSHALAVVRVLEAAGVERVHIHAIAGRGERGTDLPPATASQIHDTGRHLERTLWAANLIAFGVGVLGLAVAISRVSPAGMFLALAIVLVTFAAGAAFAMRVPDTHLDEFRGALAHGEIRLYPSFPTVF